MRVRYEGPRHDDEPDLIVGAHYTVLAWAFDDSGPRYALVDKRGDGIPRWYAGDRFALVDRRPSRYWRLRTESRGAARALFAVEPWADDPLFHDDLLAGDEGAHETFRGFRRLMEAEFPDDGVPLHGERGDREPWVHCPACRHDFAAHAEQTMLRCPRCGVQMHSPW